MKDNYFNAWLYLPPVVFTIVYCVSEGWSNFGIIFLAYLIWPFLCLGFMFLTEPIRYILEEKKEEKKLKNKILSNLNISINQWNKFSDLEREKYRKYYFKLEKLKKETIRKRYWEKNPKHLYQYGFAEDIIKDEIEKEWEILSLQQRIELIEKDELEKQEKERERLNEQRKQNEELRRLFDETERLEKSPEYIETMRLYELSQKKDAEKKKREREEFEKRKLEKEEKHKAQVIEEQKRIEEIKRKKVIEERKKQEKERYKEYYKRQQREKEKRKKWASEAIEEMIDSGEIDGNDSSDRKRTIPSDVKEIVYVRDKGCCVTCGSKENIEYDHIIPFSKGGSNSVNNIQLLCLKCNRGKSNKIM